jgi:hypothetical protein
MTVEFIKKAKGNLVGNCSVDPSVLVPGDVKVPLGIKDVTGDTVLKAVIVFHISERKSSHRTA